LVNVAISVDHIVICMRADTMRKMPCRDAETDWDCGWI